ncbi:pyruvate kinase [Pseudomonas nitritireducens]|uniref:Pyruvate kinase n=1 Tax=Pseudomonas nitroreducens TaxID=46680 RepID=A0A7W7KFA2_PSENT|nr:hypothetical protein [Pseudomonas nitritireducens]MBB4861450.1 pyruvate kinase [Pseudomonas nitritireducens]
MSLQEHLDVEPIAQVLDEMAKNLEDRAAEVRRKAAELRETKDLDSIEEALQVAVGVPGLRADLVVKVPLRQINRAHEKAIEEERSKNG